MRNVDITRLNEFVADCYLEYAALGLEPGNPEHGEWQKAHHPVPKCAYGEEEVWLLKRHHAKHGVIQSDCYDRCCIYSWEYDYLEGEMLERAKFWKAENGRRNMARQTFEQRSEYGKRREANKTPEQKKEIAKKVSETLKARFTPEERSERARAAVLSRPLEERQETARKSGKAQAGKPRNISEEESKRRADRARARNEKMNNTLYEDPSHPEIGRHNLGNLVKAQKRAGLPHGKEYRREVV